MSSARCDSTSAGSSSGAAESWPSEAGEQVEIGPGAAHRPGAAEELQPDVFFTRSGLLMRMGPISPVARTWVPPQALRSRSWMVTMRSVPSRADAFRSPAASWLLETHRDRPVLGDERVGAALRLDQAVVVERRGVEIEGGASRAEVHADRGVAEQLVEHGGEKVLAGVLLHVVEPAGPVDAAGRPAGERLGRAGGRCARLVHHVEDGDPAEPAGVVRLAAGGGIEGGAVEIDPAAVLGPVHDGGVEVAEVGVGVVQALGHGREYVKASKR